ncbi:hypothetical protein C8J55DRAFT_494195 [Lentinula edodes]|uniref:Uncharacterized protein n=1 Tax=Lentinula lateritia TaxID=40482 RepID=A0A9W8ZQ66_9AGAR|nr:hypothetical protein C8J55DRAFT_494195 [Lentinula edodes]
MGRPPSNKQAEIPPTSPTPSLIPSLNDEKTAEELPPPATPIPHSQPSDGTIATQVSSAAYSSGGEEPPSPLNSLQSAFGQLKDTEMADEDLEKVTEVESTVEEGPIVCSADGGIIGEVLRDDGLEDDEEETDEEDVLSGDEALPAERDDMDVDLAPSSLSPSEILSSLSRFNIIVEPVYHLAVCTECAIPVRLEHMYTHQKTKHFKGLNLPPELSFPSRSSLYSLLATLGADQPFEIPVGPIPRIQGVQIVQGLKCTLSGCIGEVLVPCHPLSANRRDRRFVEISPTSNSTSISSRLIEKAAETCSLLEHEQVFTIASNEREKNAVFAQSRWDEVLNGVNLSLLMATLSSSKRDAFASFKRLKVIAREYYKEVTEKLPTLPVLTRRYILSSNTSNLKYQPFRRPQEMKTVLEDSDRAAQFIAFLIVHIETPVDGFPIPLHPEVKTHLETLSLSLSDKSTSDSDLSILHLYYRSSSFAPRYEHSTVQMSTTPSHHSTHDLHTVLNAAAHCHTHVLNVVSDSDLNAVHNKLYAVLHSDLSTVYNELVIVLDSELVIVLHSELNTVYNELVIISDSELNTVHNELVIISDSELNTVHNELVIISRSELNVVIHSELVVIVVNSELDAVHSELNVVVDSELVVIVVDSELDVVIDKLKVILYVNVSEILRTEF